MGVGGLWIVDCGLWIGAGAVNGLWHGLHGLGAVGGGVWQARSTDYEHGLHGLGAGITQIGGGRGAWGGGRFRPHPALSLRARVLFSLYFAPDRRAKGGGF